MADANLDLDSARLAAGSLAHRNRDALAALVKLLRLDRELVEDLELGLERAANLVEALLCAAEEGLGGLKPLEVVGQQREAGVVSRAR